MADTITNATISSPKPALDPKPSVDVSTIPGYVALKEVSDGVFKGSSGSDRATLFDLTQDSDQVLNLGAGDDLFVFRNSGANSNINGIVEGGGSGGFDQVFFTGLISDYVFAVRSDGTIKAEYVAAGDDGAAVSFKGFESFTFRGIATDGTNYANLSLTYDELLASIHKGSVVEFPDL